MDGHSRCGLPHVRQLKGYPVKKDMLLLLLVLPSWPIDDRGVLRNGRFAPIVLKKSFFAMTGNS
jgi:hypothetical protein